MKLENITSSKRSQNKGHILHDSRYMKSPEEAKLQRQKILLSRGL
jgi:hypothetical protein